MNAAYLHITLVHFPIVLMPTSAILLAIGLWRKNASLASTGLSLCVVAALCAIPAFLLGEGAEEVVEHLPGISEDLIEKHEGIADIALWLSLAAGIASLISHWLRLTGAAVYAKSVKCALLLMAIASGALAYAAYEGGKIRHPEAHSSTVPSSETHRDDD